MTRNYLTVIVISNYAFVELLLTCRAGLDVVVDELFCIINLRCLVISLLNTSDLLRNGSFVYVVK